MSRFSIGAWPGSGMEHPRHADILGPARRGVPVARPDDLVGASTLTEIVAGTTEVIEKMCIETAVDLTGNNRMGAAKTLGLSRHDPCVRQREYGRLAREG